MNLIGLVNRSRVHRCRGVYGCLAGLRRSPMKSDVQARLGRRVSALRSARGYTQEELAERSGFTVKFISSIERGLVNVPLASLATIARGLGVTVSELTLAIDGSLPREVKTLEQLLAGRGRKEQAAIAHLLTAVNDLMAEARKTDEDE
jgi:transcriptional regulator with XRE-family HTH domain